MCDILLVDDDDHIREILASLLREAGFLVDAAATDRVAFDYLAANPPRLLLTDVNLGAGLDGLAVAGRARSAQPGLPVIYMTGRPDRLDNHHYVDGEWLLPKPFVARRLLALVRRLLDEPHHLEPGAA